MSNSSFSVGIRGFGSTKTVQWHPFHGHLHSIVMGECTWCANILFSIFLIFFISKQSRSTFSRVFFSCTKHQKANQCINFSLGELLPSQFYNAPVQGEKATNPLLNHWLTFVGQRFTLEYTYKTAVSKQTWIPSHIFRMNSHYLTSLSLISVIVNASHIIYLRSNWRILRDFKRQRCYQFTWRNLLRRSLRQFTERKWFAFSKMGN